MNYDHISFSGDAFGKIDYYAREFRDKLEEKAMQIAQEHGRTEVNKNDVTKAKKELGKIKFVTPTAFSPKVGCRSNFTCSKCGAEIIMGKGENTDTKFYVSGPCTCGMACPKCDNGSWKSFYNAGLAGAKELPDIEDDENVD